MPPRGEWCERCGYDGRFDVCFGTQVDEVLTRPAAIVYALPPIVITLGTMSVYRGAVFVLQPH